MIKSARGQALVMTVLMVPLFMLLAGLALRSGKTMLVHQWATGHCNHVVLSALSIEAQTLHALGQLNPLARKIIDSRRAIDTAIEASILAPIFEPGLIEARETLLASQRVVSTQQDILINQGELRALTLIQRETLRGVEGKVRWAFTPAPYGTGKSKTIRPNLQAQVGYEGETGSPLQIKPSSVGNWGYNGSALIRTEEFLPFWQGLSKSSDMRLECNAKIQMNDLENSWTVKLANAVNP